MNPSLIFQRLALACLLSASSAASAATVVANFDGPAGTWDWYSGTAGGGWNGAWGAQNNQANTSASVQSSNPLTSGSGNYLRATVTTTNVNTSNKQSFVTRSFDATSGGIDITKPIEFSFLFRPESTLTSTQAYLILNNVGGGTTGTGPNNTWTISTAYNSATGESAWTFGGSSTVNTGLNVTQNDVYKFTIYSDPTTNSYQGLVTNLTTGDSFSSGTIGYRYTATASDGNNLQFGARPVTSGTSIASLSYSIDEISIVGVPEPSVVALLIVAGLCGVPMLRQRLARSH